MNTEIDNLANLQLFLSKNELISETSFKANVCVTKDGKVIDNERRTVYIWKNSYGGWIVQPDDLRFVAEHERFNTGYQDMRYSGHTLTIYNGAYIIEISI